MTTCLSALIRRTWYPLVIHLSHHARPNRHQPPHAICIHIRREHGTRCPVHKAFPKGVIVRGWRSSHEEVGLVCALEVSGIIPAFKQAGCTSDAITRKKIGKARTRRTSKAGPCCIQVLQSAMYMIGSDLEGRLRHHTHQKMARERQKFSFPGKRSWHAANCLRGSTHSVISNLNVGAYRMNADILQLIGDDRTDAHSRQELCW